jgi:deoxycytidylate deaminase
VFSKVRAEHGGCEALNNNVPVPQLTRRIIAAGIERVSYIQPYAKI